MRGKSFLSMRAGGSVESEFPLRGYFLSVGSALLLLLFAADWLLPTPPPGRLMESRSALPTIRIHSEWKRPEAVVIDTSRRELLPMPAEKEIAAPPSQFLSFDVADDVQLPFSLRSEPIDGSEGSRARSTQTLFHFSETLPQLGPVLPNPADAGRRRRGHTLESPRRLAQTHSYRPQRLVRHPSFDTDLRWCDPMSREHVPCRYAFMHASTD